ncbi:MAG: hypothetical protein VW453_13510, partial [Rhodospirillaceae bacterium]
KIPDDIRDLVGKKQLVSTRVFACAWVDSDTVAATKAGAKAKLRKKRIITSQCVCAGPVGPASVEDERNAGELD